MADDPAARLLAYVGPSDYARLMEALIIGLGRPATEAELERVYTWVIKAFTGWSTYGLLVDGSIQLSFQKDGQLLFGLRRTEVGRIH